MVNKIDPGSDNNTEKTENPEESSGLRSKCRMLQIGDTKYRTNLTPKFVNRKKYVFVDPGKVFSSLPGTILDVLVKPGQNVKQGQSLVIYEAMKMKNIITVPHDGKLTLLNVKKGEVIKKGHLIAEIQQ